MAFDEKLAARVRSLLPATIGVVEKKMFGGLAFLVQGHMSVGVHGDDLIVRVDPSQSDEALRQPGVRAFDFTGRPMKGWLFVSSSALGSSKALAAWIERGVAHARSLPSK